MFTGIITKTCPVTAVKMDRSLCRYAVALDGELLTGLKTRASVSIDGTCLTVTAIDSTGVWFDAISETLNKTTLNSLKVGDLVNVERAARFGDEIGGHLLSGHIFGTATVEKIVNENGTYVLYFKCPPAWCKYLLPKGYVAIHGASLTLVDVDGTKGIFSVHLIPETLKLTNLGQKKVGDRVNIELDSSTQAIVDTVERYLSQTMMSTS